MQNNGVFKWWEFAAIQLSLLLFLNVFSHYVEIPKIKKEEVIKCNLDQSKWVYNTPSGIPQRECNFKI